MEVEGEYAELTDDGELLDSPDLYRDMDTVISFNQFGEVDEEEADAEPAVEAVGEPESAGEEEEQAPQEAVEAGEGELPEGRESPEELQARLSRAAYMLRTRDRDYKVLENRFNSLVERLTSPEKEAEEPEELEIPPADEDLGGHIAGRLDRIEKRFSKEDKVREAQRVLAEFNTARQDAISYRERVGGELYDSAVSHLAGMLYQEASETLQGKATDTEIQEQLMQGVAQAMIMARRNGQNPGEYLIRMAQFRGWRQPENPAPQPVGAAPAAEDTAKERQPPRVPKSAREKIAAEKRKAAKAGTLGVLAGGSASPKTNWAKRSLNMDEESWNREIKKIESTRGNSMSMRDLLAGKGHT